MVTTVRDFLPFGDVGPELLERVARERSGLPVTELAAVFSLGKAAVEMFELIGGPLAEAGLSPARWRLLMTLRYQTDDLGASIREIAGHLEIKEPTVTSTVDRAARDGLVQRTSDPDDRRVTRVVLTDTGHETIETLFPRILARLLAFSGALGGPGAIQDIATRLEQGVDAATPTGRNH